MSKVGVKADRTGIRIGPSAEELARRQDKARADTLRQKPNPTLADIRDLLLLVLERLEALSHE